MVSKPLSKLLQTLGGVSRLWSAVLLLMPWCTWLGHPAAPRRSKAGFSQMWDTVDDNPSTVRFIKRLSNYSNTPKDAIGHWNGKMPLFWLNCHDCMRQKSNDNFHENVIKMKTFPFQWFALCCGFVLIEFTHHCVHWPWGNGKVGSRESIKTYNKAKENKTKENHVHGIYCR